MISFIEQVLSDLKESGHNLEELHYILPSKRAGVFLKHQLPKFIAPPFFMPNIQSIEEFVEDLSQLKPLSNIELGFKLYDTYKKFTDPKDIQSYDMFSKWAPMLLQDFNEIDRYLIPQAHIFDYLSAIKDLTHWSLQPEPSPLIQNYLKFWKHLNNYYEAFTNDLLSKNQGYQGLIYREAANNLEIYMDNKTQKTHVFLGFNALNKAESQIIQGLLQNNIAQIYWDIDATFMQDQVHDAGRFARQHLSNWHYFKKHDFNFISNYYTQPKSITTIAVPKNVGQAKYVGQLLEQLSQNNKSLNNMAVVLGEESLLLPVLNSIPESVKAINVTMGLPLHLVPMATLFEQLFGMHKHNPTAFYFKDVVQLLSHSNVYPLFGITDEHSARKIIDYIQQNNLTHITTEDLKTITYNHTDLIDLMFGNWKNNPNLALEHCIALIFKMKTNYNNDSEKHRLELEYLYHINAIFNQLLELHQRYPYIDSITVLHASYKSLLRSETIDFRGEPLEGLQIMGMLESRVLDFDTVIISSVNEGILPSGKSVHSFIPFDVKIEQNLPTYKEKDAVYSYHFFRLLQRAKHVYLLYNTEMDALKGGEKSRFITQLEIEGIHKIEQLSVAPNVPTTNNTLGKIIKTPDIMERLQQLASTGFSPSSLTNYIRNPLDFYYEKVLKIKDFEDVEETIAAKTLGSVVHNTLEDFYKTMIGQELTVNQLKAFKIQIKTKVAQHFESLYKQGNFTQGKNLIIFEIAQRYVLNFINSEIKEVEAKNTIKILAVEVEETVSIKIDGLDFEIKLKGKVDRIDLYNNVIRIIDYKSGKVEQSHVQLTNWEDLTSDYDKFSKSFQVLFYAYLMQQKEGLTLPMEAGIISFKNLGAGFLKFGKKETTSSRSIDQFITKATLNEFETQLKQLILEILNPQIDFVEKEVKNNT